MTPKVITVTPATPLWEAARLLRNRQIGSLPVVEGEMVIGIITATDLLDAFLDLLTAARCIPTAASR